MSAIRIQLPDNSVKSFEQAPTILQVAESIGPGLAKNCVGGLINGGKEISDLRVVLKDNDKLEIVTANSEKGKEVLRHTGAHIMAQAVQELFKDVKVTIGPVVEEGFYYDFDTPQPFVPEDLEKIEKRMQEIVNRNLPVVREVWTADKAISTFAKMNETYKVELIEALKEKGEAEISVYKQGDWFDLCRGPHVQNTSQVKAIKVLSIAGAYWRGDQKNKQLQRVYAIAFNDKKELKEYLHNLEEAKKRDHRKVGRELNLFAFHDWAPGMPFFTPKGTVIYNELCNFIRLLYKKYGYQEVISPQIFDTELFKTSGHYQHYKDNMYFSHVGENKAEVGMKPMNCPGHCLLYATEKHSYRDLPYRMADFGRLHRYESSGALHGLTRVRSMSQDDAHVFCTEAQIQPEIESFMTFLNEVYATLGMSDYKVLIATRPESRMGTEESWDHAEGALTSAMENLNIPYQISPGDGAFYGPKIEIHFVDIMKRTWQLGTVQVDPNLPQSFKLSYVGEDNSEHRPIMLHRAILGTLERFIGIYIEHCAGKFPLWLSPVQVMIMNVTDRQNAYCEKLKKDLEAQGLRVEFDNRNEKLGYKIREAQLMQIPYMLTIGDKEMEQETVSIRLRSGEVINAMSIKDFTETVLREYKTKSLTSLLETNVKKETSH
jgi:threonyl-tRNA synthetase